MASGKKYEAPVYLGLVKMETIITQECVCWFTAKRGPEHPSLCTDTAQAVMLWLKTHSPLRQRRVLIAMEQLP